MTSEKFMLKLGFFLRFFFVNQAVVDPR